MRFSSDHSCVTLTPHTSHAHHHTTVTRAERVHQVQQGCTFASVKQTFVNLIARDDECDNIDAGAIVFVEFPGTSSQRLVDDAQKLRQMKGNLLYENPYLFSNGYAFRTSFHARVDT